MIADKDYKKIINEISEPILIFDSKLNIVNYNKSFQKLFSNSKVLNNLTDIFDVNNIKKI